MYSIYNSGSHSISENAGWRWSAGWSYRPSILGAMRSSLCSGRLGLVHISSWFRRLSSSAGYFLRWTTGTHVPNAGTNAHHSHRLG